MEGNLEWRSKWRIKGRLESAYLLMQRSAGATLLATGLVWGMGGDRDKTGGWHSKEQVVKEKIVGSRKGAASVKGNSHLSVNVVD